MGMPCIGYLRQNSEKKTQLTTCLDVGSTSMAAMAQMLVRMLFFDPEHPTMHCIYKTHKSSRAWVHTMRGFWVQIENSVFVSRVTEWLDNALAGHLYVEEYDAVTKKPMLEQLRNTCLQYGLVRTALSIEDVTELQHVAPEDLQTTLSNKQKQEYEDILLDYVMRLSKNMDAPDSIIGATTKTKVNASSPPMDIQTQLELAYARDELERSKKKLGA